MQRKSKWIAAVALAVAAGGVGTGAVAASGGDDTEPAITGEALKQATAAALGHAGGGRVSDTEVGDEDGYYEVEVTLDNGTQLDVHLDRDFNVLGTKADVEGNDVEGNDEP
ncbi:MAG: PepSY domain-containing protein [Acidimicrobiales bacterium]